MSGSRAGSGSALDPRIGGKPLDFSILDWRWFIAGAVAIGLGLLVWWTAFVLVPVGVLLISLGALRAIRGYARSD
jgi:hypothetical protein